MPTPIVPTRFYGFDTVIYAFAALIGFAIAYKAYKLHALTGKKQHFYMASAFTILSLSLATLTLTSGFTYYRFFILGNAELFDPMFGVDDIGFWIYFIASFVSYILLVLSYVPESRKMLPAVWITTTYFSYFNIVLFFLIGYVAFSAVRNWLESRNKGSALVAAGFLLVAAYHAALPFATFSKLMYVAGHISLVLGFLALLVMLIRLGK